MGKLIDEKGSNRNYTMESNKQLLLKISPIDPDQWIKNQEYMLVYNRLVMKMTYCMPHPSSREHHYFINEIGENKLVHTSFRGYSYRDLLFQWVDLFSLQKLPEDVVRNMVEYISPKRIHP